MPKKQAGRRGRRRISRGASSTAPTCTSAGDSSFEDAVLERFGSFEGLAAAISGRRQPHAGGDGGSSRPVDHRRAGDPHMEYQSGPTGMPQQMYDAPPTGSMNPFLEFVAGKGYAATAADMLEDLRSSPGGGDEAVTQVCNTPATDQTHTGGYYPLHYACQNAHKEMVQLLLDNGADPNVVKNNGASPLMCAVFSCGAHSGAFGTVANYEACVRLLLDHPGFDLESNDRGGQNTDDNSRNSPVWCAVGQPWGADGDSDCDKLLPILRLLLARGFDPDGTIHGQPALHMAVRHGHHECAIALIRAGADTGITASRNITRDRSPSDSDLTALDLVRLSAQEYRSEGDIDGAESCDRLVSELVAAVRATRAVSGRKLRHTKLRQANAAGLTNVELLRRAEQARATASHMMKLERWDDVVFTYEEAVALWDDLEDVPARKRREIDEQILVAFNNIFSAHMTSGRCTKAIEVAREMTVRSPHHVIGWYLVALGFNNRFASGGLHPRNHDDNDKVAVAMAESASALETAAALLQQVRGKSLGDGWPTKHELSLGLAKLREEFLRRQQPRSPAIQAACWALSEFNKPHSAGAVDIVSCVESITRAIELGHDDAEGLLATRGSMYYQWTKDVLDGSRGGGLDAANAKLELADADFRSYLDQVANQPQNTVADVQALEWDNKGRRGVLWLASLNLGLVHAARGQFAEAETVFVTSVKERLREELARAMEVEALTADVSSSRSKRLNMQSSRVRGVDRDVRHQMTMIGIAFEMGARKTGATSVGTPYGEEVPAEIVAVRQSAYAAIAQAVCQHALNTKRQIPSITLSVIGALLSDAQSWDPTTEIPAVLTEQGNDGQQLAERMDRAVSAVRRTRSLQAASASGRPNDLIEQATECKESGNNAFRNGELAEAVKSYTHAVDHLHAVPSANDSSSALPVQTRTLLATCLSNRAQAYLQLGDQRGELGQATEALTCARNAANDCAYAQSLEASLSTRIMDKLEARALKAHRIIALHVSQQSTPPPSLALSPQQQHEQHSSTRPRATPVTTHHVCNACGVSKSQSSYSKNQVKDAFSSI
jgi:ankyrin repeat protein